MTFEGLLTQVLNGLTIGAILMLIAMGLTVIFGLMGVVNFAHGALYMLGAYLGLEVVQATGQMWIAIIVAPRSGFRAPRPATTSTGCGLDSMLSEWGAERWWRTIRC